MKILTIAIAASLLTCWMTGRLTAATVTVDKPSPPPCCADGLCYPKTNTWGYYQGQWRRWPTEALQPTAAPTPAEQVPEIPPFQAPPPQQEDRRAPRSTKPTQRPAAPSAAPPPATPPGETPPPETPQETEPEPPQPPQMPWEQPQPTGEWDPPPTLPFATAQVESRPAGPHLGPPNDLLRHASRADSPPALPLALGRTMR